MKKYLLHTRSLLILLFASVAAVAPAQDIHFSQFGNSPLNLNPGLNGVFGGDTRFVANYRSQWRSIPVPYTTFSGTVENKFYLFDRRYDKFLTGSLQINYDKQGSLNLTSLHLGLPLSFTMPLTPNQFLTLAATPAFGQRSFGTTNISFDEQFIDCFYAPSHPFSESLVRNSLTYFDLNAGLNLRTQSATKRSRLDLGGGLHHLNRPNHNFWTEAGPQTDDVRLQRRWTAYGIGLLQLSNHIDLMGQALYQHQGGYREVVYGLGGRFLLEGKHYEEFALQVGVDFRHRYEDAVIPHVEFLWRTWMVGLSYDLNVLSDVNTLTNQRGGPEISLMYRLYKAKVPAKNCAIL